MSKDIKWLFWTNGIAWDEIECPMLGNEKVRTYYPPDSLRYTYTAPFVEEGKVKYYRYDHEKKCWDNTQNFCYGEYTEGLIFTFGETSNKVCSNAK